MKKELSAHQFPEVYKALGIDLSKLGCIMLDLEEIPNLDRIVQDPFTGTQSNLYQFAGGEDAYISPDPSKFWIKGFVGAEPHITLLYGLLTPGNESPMKELVPQILEGWEMTDAEIDHVDFFPSPYPDEPYYCIVAHMKATPELIEGNERLKMLPHINTFPGYKAHATISYIRADRKDSEEYRDWLIEELNIALKGAKVKVKALNFGGNK